MKTSNNSGPYELIPFQMIVDGIPTPDSRLLPRDTFAADPDKFRWPAEIPIVGLETRTMTLAEAQARAEDLLRRCARRLRKGERWALAEMLDDHPGLIVVPWVREAVLRFQGNGLGLRRPGRPRGRFEKHPLFVVGMVDHLIREGRAGTHQEAFLQLADLGLLTFESARDCFYRGMRDSRFAPVMVEFPEARRIISAEEAARLVRSVEWLEAGGQVRRDVEDERLGTVEIVWESP